jgi:hypothetical protein
VADAHPADALLDPAKPTVLEVALAVADADLRDRHAETGVTPWFMARCGPTDHLYETCPGLQRSLRPGDQPVRCDSTLYPEAGDVCGWCLRVWRARRGTEATR